MSNQIPLDLRVARDHACERFHMNGHGRSDESVVMEAMAAALRWAAAYVPSDALHITADALDAEASRE